MTNKPAAKSMGGARPGSGRTQTTYKISVAAAKRLRDIAKHHDSDPEGIIEGLINSYYAETIKPVLEKKRFSDEAGQLLTILTPEAQTVATICKRLRMSKNALEELIAQHQEELTNHGVHLHTATRSEVAQGIKLPSRLNPTEHTYYNKISRNLFSTKH